MLKHTGPTTTAAGPQTVGQLRSNNNNTTTSTTTNSNNNNNNNNPPARGIHLRPQQPLNISTLSANNLSTTASAVNLSTASATTAATTNAAAAVAVALSNGGQRIPLSLLHMASPPPPPAAGGGVAVGGNVATNLGGPTTTTLPMANGIGANLHTYSNQHVGNGGINHNGIGHNGIGHNGTIHNHTNHNNNTNTNNHNNYSNCNNLTGMSMIDHKPTNHGPGPREALTSLGLLCLVSLLLALLSLIFLLKISPSGREEAVTRSPTEDFVIVYDVTLALCALSLSLNLCCLLVCAIQFLFAVKLVRSPMFDGRDNKYLEKSSMSRTCAVGGFFISIPIFLTGIILYTFNHFHSTPAIITSVLIGIGIVFCGGAMVHNVFIWQKEKTISYRSPPPPPVVSLVSHMGAITPPMQFLNHSSHMMAPPFNQSIMQQQQQQLLQPTSVTPVSPNHSHGSFNPLAGGAINSSFLMRPATATPPTPKPPPPPLGNGCIAMNGREASGSVSPGLPPTLDMSNVASTSLHELSTLV